MYLSVRKTSPSLPAKIVHARLQKIFSAFMKMDGSEMLLLDAVKKTD